VTPVTEKVMSMDVVYLDYNCFQRGFDDPRQTRIQMEALACQELFARAEAGAIQLIWSFMHEDETLLCPFAERKYEVLRLGVLCKVRVEPLEAVRRLAKTLQKRGKLGARDAVHLACALHAGADYFVTCDDGLLKQAKRLKLGIEVVNPVDYVRQES
jgi:predicted nucleic acid-binding protein